MKKVYLVRHGETVTNRNHIVQGPEADLSEVGHAQAKVLAERMRGVKFDFLLASPMLRAHQTAEYIAKEKNITIESFEELREVSNPSRFIGTGYHDQAFRSHVEERMLNFEQGNTDWRDSDEESFDDIRKRVTYMLQKFDSYDGDILAVSHGHFLRFLVAHVLMSEKLTPQNWVLFQGTMWPSNTGVSVLRRNPYITDKWQLLTWNDHAHFAE